MSISGAVPTGRIADVEECSPSGLTAQLTECSILHGQLVVGHVERLDLLGGRMSCYPFLLLEKQRLRTTCSKIQSSWLADAVLSLPPVKETVKQRRSRLDTNAQRL
jgi:hypothetical protein